MILTKQLQGALKDCAEWHGHQPYTWKPASMKKLEAMGLVEPETLMYRGMVAYQPTAAGRVAMGKPGGQS